MKPYQVKLRIIGIMSIIVSLLVLWLPLPSKAVNVNELTKWQGDFDHRLTVSSLDSNHYIELDFYKGDPFYVPDPAGDQNTVVTESGKIAIPDYAVDHRPGGANTQYMPRVTSGGLFNGKASLKEVDLSHVTTKDSAGNPVVTSLKDMFNGCSALEKVTFGSNFDTASVTDFSGMFLNCGALKSLDLSMFDFSNATTVADVFAGCKKLDEITIKVPALSAAPIATPDGALFRYKYGSGNNDVDDTIALPVAGKNGLTAGEVITLKRVKDIEALEVLDGSTRVVYDDGTNTTGKTADMGEIEIGQTETFTIKLSPADIDSPKVTVVEKQGKNDLTIDPVGEQTPGEDNTITLSVTGRKVSEDTGTRILVTASSDSLKTETRSVEISFKVLETVIPVTGISLEPSRTINVSTANDSDYQLTATVVPTNASNQGIKWSVKNGGDVVAIDETTGILTAKKPGTAVIAASSVADSGIEATCAVTIETAYHLELNDQRDDVTNRAKSEMINVSAEPVRGNRRLTVTKSDGTDIKTQLGSFNEESFFKLSIDKVDGLDIDSGENYGNVTVALALPGKMWYKPGLVPVVFAYNDGGTDANPVGSTRVTLGGNTEGVQFTVNLGSPAKEYALVMGEAAPSLTITPRDTRTNPTKKAEVAKTDRTTLNERLYLQIRELAESTNMDMIQYVNNHGTYKDYSVKHFYEIYLSSDEAGNNRVNTFTEVDVRLSLPTDVDPTSSFFTILTDKASGEPAVTLDYTLTDDGAVTKTYYAHFRPTHFSEFAVLDHSGSATGTTYSITTSHDGSGFTAITSESGITVSTTASGDATAIVADSTPPISVTVTATAGSGYHFSHWTEGTSSSPLTENGTTVGASYTFEATADRTLRAVFEADTPVAVQYTVSTSALPSAGGTVTGGGTYDAGSTATVTAEPAERYTFAGWIAVDMATGEQTQSTEASYTFPVNGDKRVFAVFNGPGEVAGAERTMNALVNVNIPDVNVPAPQVTVGEPQVSVNVPEVSVNIPAVNVYAGSGATNANAGTSGTFYPLAFSRPGNYADMPRTGTVSMYRVMMTIILLLSGTVEVLLSIPAKKKRRVRTG